MTDEQTLRKNQEDPNGQQWQTVTGRMSGPRYRHEISREDVEKLRKGTPMFISPAEIDFTQLEERLLKIGPDLARMYDQFASAVTGGKTIILDSMRQTQGPDPEEPPERKKPANAARPSSLLLSLIGRTK